MSINCSDSNSLQKFKSSLNDEFGQNFNIYEPKKINPRIVVQSIKTIETYSNTFKNILDRGFLIT